MHLVPAGFGLESPRESDRRGSHVSISHEESWPITRAVIEEGYVIPDFRTPDNIRLGFSPLYIPVPACSAFGSQRILHVVQTKTHLGYRDSQQVVT